jgi:hypothetical protein
MRGDDLSFRVLQQRANHLGHACQGHGGCVLPVEEHAPLDVAFVAAGDQAVDTADEGRFAATAGAGDEQNPAGLQVKGDVPDGRLAPVAVAK